VPEYLEQLYKGIVVEGESLAYCISKAVRLKGKEVATGKGNN